MLNRRGLFVSAGSKVKKNVAILRRIRCNVLGHQRAIQKNRTTLFQEIAPHKSSLQHHTNSSLLRTTETEHFPTVLHFRSEQNHWSLTMTDSSKKKKFGLVEGPGLRPLCQINCMQGFRARRATVAVHCDYFSIHG